MMNEFSISRRNLLKGAALAAGMMAMASTPFAIAEGTDGAAGTVTLHRGYAAAHGSKSFAQVVVALDEEGTIVAVDIDEYQFMDATTEGLVPVPNSDEAFAEGCAEGMALMSKKDNDELYSARMAEKAGATQGWGVSIKAIEEFAVGKKADELEGIDTVAGATLADTAGYLNAIAVAVNDDTLASEGGELVEGAVLGRVTTAAHGTKSFCSAVTLVADGKVLATNFDEFQFMDATTEGLVPVPNYDQEFSAGCAEGMALCSKSVNNDVYSARMMEKGGATQSWLDSAKAIEASVVGAELGDPAAEVDTVSGATFADTAGYVAATLEAGVAAEA